ncbi:MAG TPA: TolC family protein [Polyangiaceae bacterium]
MRPLRFASLAAIAATFAASAALAQPPPPATAPPAPATTPPAPAAEPTKSAALQRLEEQLSGLGRGQGGLTADQVAHRTLVASPTLEARKRATEASAATVSQAKANYVPILNLSANYTRLSDIDSPSLGSLVATNATPGVPLNPATDPLIPVELQFPIIVDNYTLAARLTVPISDYFLRVGPGVASANRAHEASRFQAAATRNDLVYNARVAYYDWVRSQANELIAQQALDQATGHYTDSKNSFEAGLVSKADVLRFDTEVKGAQLRLERDKHRVELAVIRLGVLMGDRPGTRYRVGEDIFAPAPELDYLPLPDVAYSEALAKRPELKALERTESALREQIKVARAANYPRLDAQASAMYANPNPRYFPQSDEFRGTWEAGATLSWTPTDIAGAQAETSVIEAQALEVAANRRAFLENLRLDVNQVLRVAAEARFEIGVAREAVASAEEGYRVRRELFRAGRATTVEVTDAETVLTQARFALVNAHVGARVALAGLRHALGRDAGPMPGSAPQRR